MPKSFGSIGEDVNGLARIPVCLRSAKTRNGSSSCWEGDAPAPVTMEKASKIGSEMKEDIGGSFRSSARMIVGTVIHFNDVGFQRSLVSAWPNG